MLNMLRLAFLVIKIAIGFFIKMVVREPLEAMCKILREFEKYYIGGFYKIEIFRKFEMQSGLKNIRIR